MFHKFLCLRSHSWLLVLVLLAACTEDPANVQPEPQIDCEQAVHAQAGSFTGTASKSETVCAYKGIPFAGDTSYENRFAPPTEPERISGERKADSIGHVCLQKLTLDNDQLSVSSPPLGEEDCLTLNIFRRADTDDKLPVMVFIHGGAFMLGAGNWDIYDGSTLAERGAVIVTINYRLGPLGYFGNHAFTSGTTHTTDTPSGNQGLQDQIAALQWVNDNIAAFGGDDSNITIFGESAGAMSVCSLIGSPLAEGLFQRAIMESGSCQAVSTLEEMAHYAQSYAAQMGCPVSGTEGLECLREFRGETLLRNIRFDAVESAIQPTLDGHVLTELPITTVKRGDRAVPLLAGSNADEVQILSFIQQPIQALKDTSWNRYYDLVADAYSQALADGLATYYGPGSYDSPFESWNDLQNDLTLTCPTWLAAWYNNQHNENTYHYNFAWQPTGNLGDAIGAHHAIELFFVFDSLDGYLVLVDKDAENMAHALVDTMQQAWVSFARNGIPTADDLPVWPQARQGTMVLDLESEAKEAFKKEQCLFLEDHLFVGLHRAIGPALSFANALTAP